VIAIPEPATRATHVPVTQIIDVLGDKPSSALSIELLKRLVNISS
jgi:hypothetical protein